MQLALSYKAEFQFSITTLRRESNKLLFSNLSFTGMIKLQIIAYETRSLVNRVMMLMLLPQLEISPRTELTMLMSSSGPSLSGVIREYQRFVTHSVTRCLVNCSNAASTGGEFTLLLQLEFPFFWVSEGLLNSILFCFGKWATGITICGCCALSTEIIVK